MANKFRLYQSRKAHCNKKFFKKTEKESKDKNGHRV